MSLLSQRPHTSNLQNRSFRGQNFTGTDFSGTNLRGCNFDGAILRDCNFRGAKLGRSRRQWLQLLVSIGLMGNLIGVTVLNLIFASLGQPLRGTEGVLVIVLHAVLMGIGLCAVLLSRFPRLARGLGTACSGATLGFIYGGSWFEADPLRTATIGAISMAVVGLILGLAWRRGWGAIALTTGNMIASYGAVFLLWTTAIAGLTTEHYRVGSLFTVLTLVYFWFTWKWTLDWEQQIKAFGGTSFRNANLTGANFADVRWGTAQFQGAIASKSKALPLDSQQAPIANEQ